MKRYLLLGAFSFALQGFGYISLSFGLEPFRYFFFATSWWSFIVLADVVLAAKKGELSVINSRLPFMVCISCGYWCVFEGLNLRLHNWRYVGLPESIGLRYAGYLLSYGTVIPAIYLAKELARNLLPRGLKMRALHVPVRYPVYAISAGLLCLFILLVFPVVAFPLAWIFLTLIIDGYNYMKGYRSFAGDLRTGSLTDLLTSVAAGLVCGVLWEAWNYRAVSKWIYTVPFFDNLKVFEMPAAGYIGFLAFGVETVAFINLLDGLSKERVPLYMPAIIALAFSFAAFPSIDRHTVLSLVPVLYR